MVVTPGARISFAGIDITTKLIPGPNGEKSKLTGGLMSLTVLDEAGRKSDTIELELDDREHFKAPAKGSIIQVWLGYEPEPVYMGSYKVDRWTKHGPIRKLHVSAKAAELSTEIRSAKAKAWHGKTLGDITRQITSDHGLTAAIDDEMAGRTIAHIDQQHESDLHFLSRLARRNGGTFKLADGKIIIAKKGSTKLPSGRGKAHLTLTPDMVAEWTATSQDRGDYKSVHTHHMDHRSGKRVRTTAGSGKPAHRDRVLYATKNEASRAGRAALHDLGRGKANFETEGAGLPDFFAECVVTVKGFDPDVDGDYVVKTASHTLENRGYRTALTMESQGPSTDAETDPPADTDETIEDG